MNLESFDQVYEEYFEQVYRYILSISQNQSLAEEITQETFYKALRSLDKFRGESSLKSWLCAIAKNIWISRQRKKKVEPIEEVDTIADTSIDPEESIMLKDQSMHIHRLLHEIDEPYREVFTLRTLGQLSFGDIGDIFGKSANWACVVYHRARAKIKEKMEESQ